MSEVRVPVATTVPSALSAEVARRIHFVSDAILSFNLVEQGGYLKEVVLACAPGADGNALANKINQMVEAEVSGQRLLPAKRVWTSQSRRATEGGTYQRLLALGQVVELGEGQVAVGEIMIGLMDYFDARLTATVRSMFGAREYRYPTLIPTDVLRRCGYFGSFPQHVMFVTRLHTDIETYRQFAERYASAPLDPSVLGTCDNVDYCLPPTMCYHTFGQYAGTAVPAEGLVTTSRGKSFRFESRYAHSLERLWDFTIREIVFMGDQDFVLQARERFMGAMQTLVDDLGLSGHCEVANDPFFATAEATDRVWSQRLMELKVELRLAVAADRTIAVGSFNYHDNFFGDCFDIRNQFGGDTSTGCVGFGLERLAYAFVCQHGVNPAGWPDPVARALACGPALLEPTGEPL